MNYNRLDRFFVKIYESFPHKTNNSYAFSILTMRKFESELHTVIIHCMIIYSVFVSSNLKGNFNVFKSRRSYRSLLAPIHNREPGTPKDLSDTKKRDKYTKRLGKP